jgi:trimethylamine--corrinoid protein Co-methyltransferase
VTLSAYTPALRNLHATRICLEHSPVYGAPTHTPGEQELDLYKQMSRVINRKIWVLAMLIINPMKFDDAVLEFVIDHHRDQELSIEMTGGLPCIGSTSPLVFPAAHIQGLAEDLAACLFMHAVTGDYPPPYLRGDPFDMRFLNYCVAGPEYALLDLANRRLHEYLCGVPREWGYLLSMSRWPDQQAAHERTVSCWLQAMNGATYFHGTGQLSSDEVFSLEQVVIDRTIVKGAERVMKGFKCDTSFERSYQILEEGLTQGNYLNHDSTLSEYQDFYSRRELFPAMNLGQWRAKGELTPLAMVREIIDKYLAQNTFHREENEIRELRRICEYAET